MLCRCTYSFQTAQVPTPPCTASPALASLVVPASYQVRACQKILYILCISFLRAVCYLTYVLWLLLSSFQIGLLVRLFVCLFKVGFSTDKTVYLKRSYAKGKKKKRKKRRKVKEKKEKKKSKRKERKEEKY